MPPEATEQSVGLVTPILHRFEDDLLLACGKTLNGYELMYETYGELNEEKTNAVLICHALSGNHHAAGYHSFDDKRPGWWDSYIGPGKPIDTNRFYVVSLNNIGGCSGSTGPLSINPDTGKAWGAGFPGLRVRDWVNTQVHLADLLGIDVWAAVVGGSLGGMQALRWSLEYPERIKHCVVIASAMKLTAQNIAFNEVARKAITSDPEFHDGNYAEHGTIPKDGLALARMVGHITYLSDEVLGSKFGRELRSGSFKMGQDEGVEFQIQSYLNHQGESFSGSFDAISYIRMTQALDFFDLAREYGNNAPSAFANATCDFFVVSFTSDWRFSPERSQETVKALMEAQKNVSYVEIESKLGHDAFLLPNTRYQEVFSAYMNRVFKSIKEVK
ncbi:Homoserine O-succinyltransferase [Sinobacterium norvegicum]|uniref:Homoserine O-succinyltransferase n=1 Tax=Sinobacterium norvegicum TaxID=1641715 RepID=A0ABN8EKR0_9GAMM|nr:homoserine O-acetyltransferase [Sinobacterium norvegicum]CAH0992941.1 Homoserine O-succinyltransferase [Sinobacterium norvegicum]